MEAGREKTEESAKRSQRNDPGLYKVLSYKERLKEGVE